MACFFTTRILPCWALNNFNKSSNSLVHPHYGREQNSKANEIVLKIFISSENVSSTVKKKTIICKDIFFELLPSPSSANTELCWHRALLTPSFAVAELAVIPSSSRYHRALLSPAVREPNCHHASCHQLSSATTSCHQLSPAVTSCF